MDLHPFPFIREKDKPPIDGLVFTTPGYCNRAKREICASHYSKIRGLPGFHTCPFGYTSFVPKDINHEIITGLRVEGHYDQAKLKNRKEEDGYSPGIPKVKFDRMIVGLCEKMKALREYMTVGEQLVELRKKNTQATEDAIGMSHDIRNLNRDIKSAAEDINRMLGGPIDQNQLEDLGQTIFALSSLVSTRLTAVELAQYNNPVIKQTRKSQPVHNKFYKAQKCLRVWAQKQKQKEITLVGESFVELDMLPIFDLLPFILLENAIKYSPPNGKIHIQFQEANAHLYVSVVSIGPYVEPDEIARLGKERYRSRNAKKADSTGSGRGLELASKIAQLHNMAIDFSSSKDVRKYDGIAYSEFGVHLAIRAKFVGRHEVS